MSVLEDIEAVTEAVTKAVTEAGDAVVTGEDADAERRAGKSPIARSDCSYYCPDRATADRVIEALRISDERLRSRPEELGRRAASPR